MVHPWESQNTHFWDPSHLFHHTNKEGQFFPNSVNKSPLNEGNSVHSTTWKCPRSCLVWLEDFKNSISSWTAILQPAKNIEDEIGLLLLCLLFLCPHIKMSTMEFFLLQSVYTSYILYIRIHLCRTYFVHLMFWTMLFDVTFDVVTFCDMEKRGVTLSCCYVGDPWLDYWSRF